MSEGQSEAEMSIETVRHRVRLQAREQAGKQASERSFQSGFDRGFDGGLQYGFDRGFALAMKLTNEQANEHGSVKTYGSSFESIGAVARRIMPGLVDDLFIAQAANQNLPVANQVKSHQVKSGKFRPDIAGEGGYE